MKSGTKAFLAGMGTGLLLAAGVAGIWAASRPTSGGAQAAATASSAPPQRDERDLARELCAIGDYGGCLSTLDDLAQQDPASASDPLVQKLRANAETQRLRLASAQPANHESGNRTFDSEAAKEAVTAVTDSLTTACSSDAGPNGAGHVKVTFAPNGAVRSVELDLPFDGTPVGKCIASKLRGVRVASFDGDPQTVSKNFLVR